ncbi:MULTISPECIES: hypothetical protein [unclassified Myroides]|uniref:hypothetical protein n=1 Tax=unclassified Myroides TaxID=2642485 RepID=UPI003D2F6FB3
MNLSKLNSTLTSCAIIACLGLFSIAAPAFAQEKEQFTIKNKTFAYEISKETTAADLAAIEKEINAEKVATLHFSNVKRNEKNEIIGITTQFKDERGSSQKKSEYNSQGIRPFAVKIHENTQGEKYLEITNDSKSFTANTSTNVASFSDFFSDESTDSLLEQSDIMEMMRTMQESMQQQEEMIKKLFEEKGK